MKRIRKLNCNQEMSPVDQTFLEDVDRVIVDDYGSPVELDQLLVVKNDDTNAVGLFMPSETEPSPPEGYTVVGTVLPNEENTINNDILQPDGEEDEGFLEDNGIPDEMLGPGNDDIPDMPGGDDDFGEEAPVDDQPSDKKRPDPEDEYNPWENA